MHATLLDAGAVPPGATYRTDLPSLQGALRGTPHPTRMTPQWPAFLTRRDEPDPEPEPRRWHS